MTQAPSLSLARAVAILLATLVAVGACAPSEGDLGPGDATIGDGWSPLVATDWTLAPGEEAYLCVTHTLTEDLDVAGFRAVAPPGTHHSLLTVTQATAPDAVFPCGPGTLSDAMIYASGVATDDLSLPEGVAMHIDAGQQLLLNLHLLNTTASELSGHSGVHVARVDEPESEAEMIFAGTTDITLLPGAEVTASGSCHVDEAGTLFGLWPHMHRFGVHMRISHHQESGETVLHDAPFSFSEQLNYPIAPVALARGDVIEVTCTWHNTSAEVVYYGDSSLDEMCFAGLYRHPALDQGLFCDPH